MGSAVRERFETALRRAGLSITDLSFISVLQRFLRIKPLM